MTQRFQRVVDACIGRGQDAQDAFALLLTVAGEDACDAGAIHQQADAVSGLEEGLRQAGGRLDRVVEQPGADDGDVDMRSRVKDQADVGDTLLLVLVRRTGPRYAAPRPSS